MNELKKYIMITPETPMLFRDAKPFSEGMTLAKTMNFPLPSVTAGSLRSAIGRKNGIDLNDPKEIENLLKIEVHGPVLRLDDFYFPAPFDAVMDEKTVKRLSPFKMSDGQGVNFAQNSLIPCGLNKKCKPGEMQPFWSLSSTLEWLNKNNITAEDNTYTPIVERRTHVKIDPASYAAEEGALYSTEGVSFKYDKGKKDGKLALKIRWESETAEKACSVTLPYYNKVGGEGGFAEFSESVEWPKAPAIFNEQTRIKMQLATPGIFANGWLPGWVDEKTLYIKEDFLQSRGLAGFKIKLVSAAVNRWKPASGWDMKERKPKRLCRMAPAGSVYFFEVEPGKENTKDFVEKNWLEPMSDDPQHRRDGFGLALWGLWNYQEDK